MARIVSEVLVLSCLMFFGYGCVGYAGYPFADWFQIARGCLGKNGCFTHKGVGVLGGKRIVLILLKATLGFTALSWTEGSPLKIEVR